jgi:hypothetical protein
MEDLPPTFSIRSSPCFDSLDPGRAPCPRSSDLEQEATMRLLLTLFLGIGTVSAVACKAHQTSEMKAETVTLALTGMT